MHGAHCVRFSLQWLLLLSYTWIVPSHFQKENSKMVVASKSLLINPAVSYLYYCNTKHIPIHLSQQRVEIWKKMYCNVCLFYKIYMTWPIFISIRKLSADVEPKWHVTSTVPQQRWTHIVHCFKMAGLLDFYL